LIIIAIETKNLVITVTGRSIPFLKRGVILDITNILAMDQYKDLNKHISKYNIQDRKLTFKNGSFIEFPIFQTEGDAKGSKRHILFINEADSIDFVIAEHLYTRTMAQEKTGAGGIRFIDYNPSAPFWVHDKIIPRDDCQLIISDHRGNQFLTQDKHDEIENHPDDDWWRVYARGLTGNITGLCFPNWKVIQGDEWRKEVQDVIWGGDIGYTSSKTAIVKIHILSKTEVVIEEVYYKPETDDAVIQEVLDGWGYASEPSYWDHNMTDKGGQPMQVLALLKRRGINAMPAFKAGKSQQIQKIRGIQVWYTSNSLNVAAERARYRFKMFYDNNGNQVQTNSIDEGTPNHIMDAIQYGIYTHFLRNNMFL
jgi:phage terminase large subunit